MDCFAFFTLKISAVNNFGIKRLTFHLIYVSCKTVFSNIAKNLSFNNYFFMENN